MLDQDGMRFITIVSVAALCACGASQVQLEAQAKVSKSDAEKVALSQAPDGMIKHSELERENGKLVWSFDIATPGSADITEVQVDAVTGEIARVEKETPGQEQRERQ